MRTGLPGQRGLPLAAQPLAGSSLGVSGAHHAPWGRCSCERVLTGVLAWLKDILSWVVPTKDQFPELGLSWKDTDWASRREARWECTLPILGVLA